jgi:hypothetical protein
VSRSKVSTARLFQIFDMRCLLSSFSKLGCQAEPKRRVGNQGRKLALVEDWNQRFKNQVHDDAIKESVFQ